MAPHDVGTDLLLDVGDAPRLLGDVLLHAGACIKVLDLDGRVIRWSPACQGLYGWSPEEAVGRVLPHIPPERRLGVIERLRAIAESGEVAEFTDMAQNAAGWHFNLRLTVLPIVDRDGDTIGLLTIACEPLVEDTADVLHDRLSAFTNRTMREPLAAIANAARLLSHPEVAGDPERRAHLLTTIASLAEEAGDLVDDLGISSGDSDNTTPRNKHQSDVGALVAEVAAALGSLAQRVLVDFEPGAASAAIDRTRIARALAIMLRVAVVSAEPGSPILASARRDGPGVAIDVRFVGDHPAGEALTRTFEAPLSETDDSVITPWTRLYLVRGAAEAHGGDAHVVVDAMDNVTLTMTLS